MIAPDERRRRLAPGADLHASERYDGAQPYSDLNISVASLKFKYVVTIAARRLDFTITNQHRPYVTVKTNKKI